MGFEPKMQIHGKVTQILESQSHTEQAQLEDTHKDHRVQSPVLHGTIPKGHTMFLRVDLLIKRKDSHCLKRKSPRVSR